MSSCLTVCANISISFFLFNHKPCSLAFYTTIAFDSYIQPTFSHRECFYHLFPKFKSQYTSFIVNNTVIKVLFWCLATPLTPPPSSSWGVRIKPGSGGKGSRSVSWSRIHSSISWSWTWTWWSDSRTCRGLDSWTWTWWSDSRTCRVLDPSWTWMWWSDSRTCRVLDSSWTWMWWSDSRTCRVLDSSWTWMWWSDSRTCRVLDSLDLDVAGPAGGGLPLDLDVAERFQAHRSGFVLCGGDGSGAVGDTAAMARIMSLSLSDIYP